MAFDRPSDPPLTPLLASNGSQVHLIHEYWLPILLAGIALLLFFIHNWMLNLKELKAGGCISENMRHASNVLSTAAAYMLCSFTTIVFNKLILRAIPLPAFVAAVQVLCARASDCM